MERLTFKKKENDPYVHGKAYVTCNVKGCLSITCEAEPPCERMQEVVDRLYDFENILGDDYDLDQLRKLVEEDRAGRCKKTGEDSAGIPGNNRTRVSEAGGKGDGGAGCSGE